MRKIVTVIFFFCFVHTSSWAQTAVTAQRNLLEWNKYYKLTWDDFSGQPGPDAIGDAGTAVNIKAKPYYWNGKIMYDVYAYFNRDKSWKRDQSDELLAHEQLHFDIAELYARKIRRKIEAMRKAGVNDVDKFNDAIRDLLDESNHFDQQYDTETLHGALARKQALWRLTVEQALLDLEPYHREKRVIGARKASMKPFFHKAKKYDR